MSDDAGVPWDSTTFRAILVVAFMAPLDVPLVSPVLPAARDALGISGARASLLLSAYAVPGIVMAPLLGVLADRLGRRAVLVPSLLLYGTAGTACALVADFDVVLALRVLQGFAAGSVLVTLALTLAGDAFEGRRRDAVMGLTSSTLAVGVAVYPAVGGALTEVAWNAPFAMYVLPLAVAGYVAVALEEPARPSQGGGYLRAAVAAVPAGRALALYGTVLAAFVLLMGGVLTAVPLMLGETFGLSGAAVGRFTSAALLVTAVVSATNGRLLAYRPRRWLLAAGFVCYGAGLAVVGLAATRWVAVAGLLAFGAGHGLVLPSLFTALDDLAPERFRAGVMSIRTSVTVLAQAAGPAAFVALAPVLGYDGALLAAGVVAAVAGVVALGRTRFASHRPA